MKNNSNFENYIISCFEKENQSVQLSQIFLHIFLGLSETMDLKCHNFLIGILDIPISSSKTRVHSFWSRFRTSIFILKCQSMPRSSMLSIDEEVPIISSLHYGFEGGFAINVIRACRTMLLKSGPVCTYSTILSMLSITISEDFDLYASLNTLSMLLIFPSGPTPTNFSGVISFTNSNFD